MKSACIVIAILIAAPMAVSIALADNEENIGDVDITRPVLFNTARGISI